MSSRLARLAVIGTVAGLFSGLFGVGGGAIIVPLLIIWLGFGDREATGTSLAAVALIAALAAGLHALYGNVDALAALLIAAPAIAGAVAGTALQQRVPPETVSWVLAALFVASAAILVL